MTFSTWLCKTRGRSGFAFPNYHEHLSSRGENIQRNPTHCWAHTRMAKPWQRCWVSFPSRGVTENRPKICSDFPHLGGIPLFQPLKAFLTSCFSPESKAGYGHLISPHISSFLLISPPQHFPVWEQLFPERLWKKFPRQAKNVFQERATPSPKNYLSFLIRKNELMPRHSWIKQL